MNSNIVRARTFAIHAHKHQTYGDKPYLYHLEMVANYVLPFGETAQIIAYLHDTVEDTEVKIEEVQLEFGPVVAACVHYLTDEPGRNRAQRKQRTNNKMATINAATPYKLALIVKTADRLANIQESYKDTDSKKFRMYVEEYPDFKRAVYRKDLCETLWEKIELLVSDHVT